MIANAKGLNMKQLPSLLVLVIAGIIAPLAVAGQQGVEQEGQKARLDPVVLNNLIAVGTVLADASSAAAVPTAPKEKYDAAYSVCGAVVPVTHKDFSLANRVGPSPSILYYFMSHGEEVDIKTWQVRLVDGPKHGTYSGDIYSPDEGYLGLDQMTFVVEAQGKKFKVIETVWVENAAPDFGCPTDIKLPPAAR
jgi:hypothetical protein